MAQWAIIQAKLSSESVELEPQFHKKTAGRGEKKKELHRLIRIYIYMSKI